MIPRNADPLEGKRISQRYRIKTVEQWHEHAVFCTGEDLETNKTVSLVLIDKHAINNTDAFEKLAKKKVKLRHDNIVSFLDYGQTQQEEPFIVLDFAGAKLLSQTISAMSVLAPKQAVDIISQLIDGLTFLANNGEPPILPIPDRFSLNAGIQPTPKILCTDFPGAISEESLLRQSSLPEIESARYTPPESFKEKKVDSKSQIYSLGCLLYRLLTGVLPFESDDLVELQSQQLCVPPKRFHEARPDLYIPAQLEACVLKALEKDSAKRHESLLQFKIDLKDAIRKSPWWQRRWREAAALVLACAAAVYASGAVVQPFWFSTAQNNTDIVTNVQVQDDPPVQPVAGTSNAGLIPEVPVNAKELGQITLSGSNAKTISAGDYKCTRIELSRDAKLIADGKVNLWIVGDDIKSNLRISDNAQFVSSTHPDDLHIYYGGNDAIIMSGKSKLKATVLAPSALLDASGNSTIEGEFSSAGQKLSDKARFLGGPDVE